MLDLTGFEI